MMFEIRVVLDIQYIFRYMYRYVQYLILVLCWLGFLFLDSNKKLKLHPLIFFFLFREQYEYMAAHVKEYEDHYPVKNYAKEG